MNETTPQDSPLEVPTFGSYSPPLGSGTSMFADSEKPAPAAASLLAQAVQGAHDTIDRLGASAAPAVEQLAERAAAAQDALEATSEQMRETGNAWVEGVRTSVRDNPLAALAAALALGLVVARITR
jgi:ElaB/YqjD/DUF883 family membrane-anchored ribosome-binding protein